MSFFSFFRRRLKETPAPRPAIPAQPVDKSEADNIAGVRRHFYNEKGFQCYASFFTYWDGWITAGHVLTDAAHQWPEFTGKGSDIKWPGGLDAALKSCRVPNKTPSMPVAGRKVKILGYPAGSRHLESRNGVVYIEREAGSGIWIAHIQTPDEPVVSGMSGGPVIDIASGEIIGIVITRNSPADLNADRDPDESCDFVSLSAVWDAVTRGDDRLMS